MENLKEQGVKALKMLLTPNSKLTEEQLSKVWDKMTDIDKAITLATYKNEQSEKIR